MFPMMRRSISLHVVLGFAFTLAAPLAARAQTAVLPLWPHATPEPAQTTEPEKDVTTDRDALISGHRSSRLTNVTNPTISVYPPAKVTNNGAAALVFPGGGYVRLAWNGEGTDTCDWLNSLGMTCLLVKYRVPEQGRYPENYADLEDAQQAMRLARAHAAEWHINPHHIGVIGFSAGGNLAVLLSTHPDDTHVASSPAASEADTSIDARPDFAIIGYPAYLLAPTGTPNGPQKPGELPTFPSINPVYTPNDFTPPTFLIQAENDRGYGGNAIVYYEALSHAHIPAELHIYAEGGHGFGMHPVGKPEEHWSHMAAEFLRELQIIPPAPVYMPHVSANSSAPQAIPATTPPACPVPVQPPVPGKADKSTPQPTIATDPACW